MNKNLVELCALLVILVTGSGRFAGLDRTAGEAVHAGRADVLRAADDEELLAAKDHGDDAAGPVVEEAPAVLEQVQIDLARRD